MILYHNKVKFQELYGILLEAARRHQIDLTLKTNAQLSCIVATDAFDASAYDFAIYGGLDATLEHIGADSVTDDKGNSYFLVRVRTKNAYIEENGKKLPIIPGMMAEVDILTGKKTVLSYLLKPVLRAKATALTER